MYVSSSRLRCQFTRTTGACSLLAAPHTSKNSIEFGSMMATRSSAPMPRDANVCASRVVRSSNSAYVRTSSPQIRAALSGVRATCSWMPISMRARTYPGPRVGIASALVPIFLTTDELHTLQAACQRLIPPLDEHPGASSLGAADYIDG